MSGEPLRLLVIADFLEEEWPSMDLSADMLFEFASRVPGTTAVRLRPEMWMAARRLHRSRRAKNLDRAAGRYLQYPLAVLAARGHSAYHIVDHSYAHLAFCLPRGRVGVYCHDIDAFRAALEPGQPGLGWRSALSRALLSGLERARVVFYSTDAVRRDLERYRLASRARLVKAPIGVAPEFTEGEPKERDRDLMLHVGSLIPRKNPRFLLQLLRELRRRRPNLRLLQVGGDFGPAERRFIAEAGLERAIVQKRGLTRRELASLYRVAGVVVQPSLSEGFGIPVAEALACGAKVVASDLENLREVGGEVVTYCPVSDLVRWGDAVEAALDEDSDRDRQRRIERGRGFSWQRHAEIVVGAYQELLAR